MAKGRLDDRTKSTNPAENPKPAIQCIDAAINKDTPVNTACNKYSPGATNIKANSTGSVIPVKKVANPAANIIDFIFSLFSGFAVFINAKAAPTNPNIMIGKNPA